MKKIYSSLVAVLTALILSSCGNSWLNLDPSDSTETSKAIFDYKSAKVALVGIYDGVQGSSSRNTYYAARMLYSGDVRGDDMQARTQGMRSSSSYEMRYNLDNAPVIWDIPYNVILRANDLLFAIEQDKVKDATVEQLNNLKSEALAIRALVHFDLCKLYGVPYSVDNGASMGVPIATKPLAKEDLPGRSTVAEVYKQVIDDLKESLNIGGLVQTKSYGAVNEWYVKALLSKVYLYKEDNKEALELAENVLVNSPYALWTAEEYVDGWQTKDSGRKEMLFEIVNKDNSDWTDREGIAYLMNEDGYADLIATESFINMLGDDPNDVRNKILLAPSVDEDFIAQFGDKKVFVNKYPSVPSTGEMRLNSVPMMRLSEVYLIASEAAAKLNKLDKAAEYLNVIHLRANPQAAPISQADVTLSRISIERRKELVGEGQRFFDAMRNNETVIRYTNASEGGDMGLHYTLIPESQQFDRTYFRTLLPIPVAEVNANSVLRGQQNPGYGS